MLLDEVHLVRLIKGSNGPDSIVYEGDQVRKSIPEEAADAYRDVYAGTAELLQRYDLQTRHASRLLIPDRTDAQKRQDLRYIIPLGPHRRRAPHHDTDCLWITPLLFKVTLQQIVGKPLPNLPREPGRQRLRVDRVEVAPRGQHVNQAARRRPGWPRRDVPARKTPQ